MIDKRSIRSLIENCETQIFNCEQTIQEYLNTEWSLDNDVDQIQAFKLKIIHYEFMINRLNTFL